MHTKQRQRLSFIQRPKYYHRKVVNRFALEKKYEWVFSFFGVQPSCNAGFKLPYEYMHVNNTIRERKMLSRQLESIITCCPDLWTLLHYSSRDRCTMYAVQSIPYIIIRHFANNRLTSRWIMDNTYLPLRSGQTYFGRRSTVYACSKLKRSHTTRTARRVSP